MAKPKKEKGTHSGTSGRYRAALLAGISLATVFSCNLANAASADTKVEFNIPAQSLRTALAEYAAQSDIQMMFSQSDVARTTSQSVAGEMTLEQALKAILRNSGLEYVFTDSDTVVIRKKFKKMTSNAYQKNDAVYVDAVRSGPSNNSQNQQQAQMMGAKDSGHSSLEGDIIHLEEILVTAQKREQSLQHIPMSMSALTSGQLSAVGATAFEDYARLVPGLSFIGSGEGQRKIVLRGVSNSNELNQTPSRLQQSVGIYLDEIAITNGALSVDLKLFDLERVEVLRGPQGTLYGAGSQSGAVRLITKKPNLQDVEALFKSSLSQTRYGGTNYNFNIAANFPIIKDKLAIRVSTYYYKESGFVDNMAGVLTDNRLSTYEPFNGMFDINYNLPKNYNPENQNSERTWGGRFSALLVPTDELTIAASVVVQHSDFAGYAGAEYRLGNKNLKNERFAPEPWTDDFVLVSLNMDYDLGWSNFTSVTGYSDWRGTRVEDLAAELAGPLSEVIGLNQAFASPQESSAKIKTFSQEVRLASKDDGRFTWLVGAFYSANDVFQDQLSRSIGLTDAFVDELGLTRAEVNDIFQFGIAGEDVLLRDTDEPERKQIAFFGQLGYQITDRLNISGGLRWFKINSSTRESNLGFVFDDLISEDDPNYPYTIRTGKASDSATTPMVRVSYQATNDHLIYAQAAQGRRAGGVNSRVPFAGGSVPPGFSADSLWNYEMGVRTAWLNNRLILNVAAFYIDWTDIQVPLQTPGGFGYIGNAGKAKIKGVEYEAVARPMEGLELSLSGMAIDAKIKGETASDPDLRIPGTPEFTISGAIQYQFPVFAGGYNAVIRADVQHVGSIYSVLSVDQSAEGAPSGYDLSYGNYELANLRVGIQNDKMDLTLFVKNLLDARAKVNAVAFAPASYLSYFSRPRTIGVELSFQY